MGGTSYPPVCMADKGVDTEKMLEEMRKENEESQKRFDEAMKKTTKVAFPSDDTHPALRTKGWSAKCGDFVAVAPCDKKFGGKTYLGIYIGELALMVGAQIKHDDPETLHITRSMYNPLMFVPELGETVMGCGSWWHKIEKEEDLKQITDADIENVWYVKALKSLSTTPSTK